MATYYGTYGQKVQYLASDPSDPQIGQVWYNSTSATLKVRGIGTASWASGGNLTGPSRGSGAGFGIQTAAVYAGGDDLVANNAVTTSAGYNGSSWTSITGLPSARGKIAGLGTQTAGIALGGVLPTNISPVFVWYDDTLKYNGSSWTSSGAYPTTIEKIATAGIQTAGLAWGGTNAVPAISGAKDSTNTFNGSTWTGAPTLPVTYANWQNGGFGTNTAAVGVFSESPINIALSFNGSSWTSIPALNNTRPGQGMAFGTVGTAGVFAGGNNPFPLATETWNGSSWENSANMSSQHAYGGSAGTAASGLITSGGDSSPDYGTEATEEWTGAVGITKTVTVS
jgi:hypothetical protein